jgi:pyruvate,water dikinase
MRWTRRFAELGMADVPLVGGKNASLGEMVRSIPGVRVPDGFAVTAEAYRYFLSVNGLEPVIRDTLAGLDLDDVAGLQRRGLHLRQAILKSAIPWDLEAEIAVSYGLLWGGDDGDVAVRSSATAEDLPDASFAGQQDTFLNIRGRPSVLDAVRRCFASLFTDRAISYRAERHYDPLAVALSVGVQRMVRSDLACAGVMFTLDTESGFREAVLINAAYGLGESVVNGTVNPDEYLLFKPTLREGYRPIVRKVLGTKEIRRIYDTGGSRTVRTVPVPAGERARFALTDDEVLALAGQAMLVEAYHQRPMDLEWAKDGISGELFIVQARPETVHARAGAVLERWTLEGSGRVLATGRAVGEKVAAGPIRVLRSVAEMDRFRDGEVLVAEKTDPDWEPVMRRASAIVTARGGRTCHAAIVSRELGVPAVVGAEKALEELLDGLVCTVSCAEGEAGVVYEGRVPFRVERLDTGVMRRPTTKVMLNVGNPAEALRLSRLPNDGVGLARQEFIVSSMIGIHPMALVRYEEQSDRVRAEIDRRTVGWDDKPAFFVDKLAEGIGLIAAAFHPNDVIVRLSDFKTNEYAHLVGGIGFEPLEENPMLGFRGASRYDHPRYAPAFALECAAIRRVRDDMGLRNLKVMVPFCRTVDEGRAVVAAMARNGLVRGQQGLEVYVMCEIPSNAILAEQFATVFDGFSIGSNDLTQLVLGVDRDSEIVAPVFDERNEAVMWTIDRAIRGAHAGGRKIGICGQAPSDYPEFTKQLVRWGIDSVSLNPDAIVAVTARILVCESELALEHALARRPEAALVPAPAAPLAVMPAASMVSYPNAAMVSVSSAPISASGPSPDRAK